jgi:hypothetical protein
MPLGMIDASYQGNKARRQEPGSEHLTALSEESNAMLTAQRDMALIEVFAQCEGHNNKVMCATHATIKAPGYARPRLAKNSRNIE